MVKIRAMRPAGAWYHQRFAPRSRKRATAQCRNATFSTRLVKNLMGPQVIVSADLTIDPVATLDRRARIPDPLDFYCAFGET